MNRWTGYRWPLNNTFPANRYTACFPGKRRSCTDRVEEFIYPVRLTTTGLTTLPTGPTFMTKKLPAILAALSLLFIPLHSYADQDNKGPSDQAYKNANDNAAFKRDHNDNNKDKKKKNKDEVKWKDKDKNVKKDKEKN